MTMVIVTHELPSAFRIADRLAMLYQGSLIAVGTKEEFQSSTHPRVRQFLDRVPDPVAEASRVDDFFQRYLEGDFPK
jgi:phospholipid/cholesterol/gamma-HCH transport system ATP-binding protein